MARTIAQARAEVAESRPRPSQPAAGEEANPASPDVAAAAERLRQIAWTMRACGVELPASDQIAQIAETILSADALRGLGEQRAQKLTEALAHLEQRIDRMLEGHRTGVARAEQPSETTPPSDRNEREAPLPTTALAMIAAAMRANAAAAAEAAPSPSPAAIPTEGFAPADVAEYPMDDDVVLTVADSTVASAAAASLTTEPFAAETVEAAPTVSSDLADDGVSAPPETRADLEVEPLTQPSATEENTEAESAALELEPLAVADDQASEAQTVAATPEEAPGIITAEVKLDDPSAETPSADVAVAEPPADVPLPTVAAQPETATDTPASDANNDLPPTLAADAPAAVEPEAVETDAIALQVDQDLDHLADDAQPHDGAGDVAAETPAAAAAPARPQLVHTTEREEEPAEFLLEESPRKVPVSALVASAQASRAQLSDTLAAIESELFGSTRPPGDAPAEAAETSVPAKPVRADQGPLAALAAMSREERIALFS
jgi:hypothetical protein